MKNRVVLIGLAAVGMLIAGVVYRSIYSNPSPVVPDAGIRIPFELVTNHILLKLNVNKSRPLSFILDTGNKYAIVELETAKELGLTFGREVEVKGAGSETPKGYFVDGASFTIPGYDGFSQSVELALPLRRLAAVCGHDFDGILGSEFIEQFALELDYQHHEIILHNKDKFTYSGKGESIPIRVNHAGHLLVDAQVTMPDRKTALGSFTVDIGSGGTLTLHSPFVEEHHLPGPDVKTVRAIGKVGAGGESVGRIGRTAELQIGHFRIQDPVTTFSQDRSGALANSSEIGNIGAQIMNRFNIVFDYSHDRIFLEPNAAFADSFACAFNGGLYIQAEGKDYRTFRVKDILDNSPASEADIHKEDIIETVDGKSLSDITLTQLMSLFEKPVSYNLIIRRGEKRLEIKFTPRKLV